MSTDKSMTLMLISYWPLCSLFSFRYKMQIFMELPLMFVFKKNFLNWAVYPLLWKINYLQPSNWHDMVRVWEWENARFYLWLGTLLCIDRSSILVKYFFTSSSKVGSTGGRPQGSCQNKWASKSADKVIKQKIALK